MSNGGRTIKRDTKRVTNASAAAILSIKDRVNPDVVVRVSSSQPKPCLKQGERWFTDRVQLRVISEDGKVCYVTVGEIASEIAPTGVALNLKLHSIELHSIAAVNATGIYASLYKNNLLTTTDTSNNLISAEDFGNGVSLAGVKFTLPPMLIKPLKTFNNTKTNILELRPSHAHGSSSSAFVITAHVSFQLL